MGSGITLTFLHWRFCFQPQNPLLNESCRIPWVQADRRNSIQNFTTASPHCRLTPPPPPFPNWLLILSPAWAELISYHSAVCSCSRHNGFNKLLQISCNHLIRKYPLVIQNHRLLLFVINGDTTKAKYPSSSKVTPCNNCSVLGRLNAREVVSFTHSSPWFDQVPFVGNMVKSHHNKKHH